MPDERFDAVLGAASGISLEPFTLTLDRFGYFAVPQVLWLGPSQTPDGLRALSRDLCGRWWPGWVHPGHQALSPHLTLARKVRTSRT